MVESFRGSSSLLVGGEVALGVEVSDRVILGPLGGGGMTSDCLRDGGLLLGR